MLLRYVCPVELTRQGNGIRGYIYMPLSEWTSIRLLHLLSGRGSDPWMGTVTENKSAVDGYTDSYEAISYIWGDAVMLAFIELDGCTARITKSLEAALLHVRSSRTIQKLWVDQICINQEDAAERSTQVQQMDQVYAKAERVHVWLGPSNENSGVGMMLLQQLCYDRQLDGDPSWKDLTPDMVRAGIEDIMDRPWFHRIWVVQEAAVAKNVTMYCGHHQFSWNNSIQQVRTFSRAIKVAVLSPAWAQTELSSVSMEPFLQVLQRQLENGPEGLVYKANLPPLDLLDIAYEMRDRKSTDPRDRIFAMLRFADEETRKKLQPDYSMSMEHLYRQFEEVLLSRQSMPSPSKQQRAEDGMKWSRAAQSSFAETRDDLEECWEIVNHDEKNPSGATQRKRFWDITTSAFMSGGQKMRAFRSSLESWGPAENALRPVDNGSSSYSTRATNDDLPLKPSTKDSRLLRRLRQF